MTFSLLVLLGLSLVLVPTFAQNAVEDAYNLCRQGGDNSNILVRGICDPYELLGVDAQILIEEKLIQLKRLLPCACGEEASCVNVERGNARHDVLVIVTKDFPRIEPDATDIANNVFETAKLGSPSCANGLLLINAYDQGELYVVQGGQLINKVDDILIIQQVSNVEKFIAEDTSQPRQQKLDSFIPGFLDWYINAAYPQESEAGLPAIIPSRAQPSLGAYQYCRYEDINARLCDPNEVLVPQAKLRVQQTLDTMAGGSLPCPCTSCSQKGINYDPYIIVAESLNETTITETSEAIYRDAQLGSTECDNGALVMLASDRKQLYMKQGNANKAIVPTEAVFDKISSLLNRPDGETGATSVTPEFMEWYEEELRRGTVTSSPIILTAAPPPVLIPVPVATPEPVIFVTFAPEAALTNPPVLITNAPEIVTTAPLVVTNAPEVVSNPPVLLTNAPEVVTNAPIPVAVEEPDYSWNAWELCREGTGLAVNGQLCDPNGLFSEGDRNNLRLSLKNLQDTNSCRCPANNATSCGGRDMNYKVMVVASSRLNKKKSVSSSPTIYKEASLANDQCDNGLLLLQGVESGELWARKGPNTKLTDFAVRSQLDKQENSAKLVTANGATAAPGQSKDFIQWYASSSTEPAKKASGISSKERDTIIGAVFGVLGALLLLLLLLCCCCGWCPCCGPCCSQKKSESYTVTNQQRVVPYGVAVASSGGPNGPKSLGSNHYFTTGSSTLRSNKPLIAANNSTLRSTGPPLMVPKIQPRPVSSLGFVPQRRPPIIRPPVAMSHVSASPRPMPRGPGLMGGLRMPGFLSTGLRRTGSVPYVHHTSSESDLRPTNYIETANRPPSLPAPSKEVQARGMDINERSDDEPRRPFAIEEHHPELEIFTYTIERPEICEVDYGNKPPLAIMPGTRTQQYATSYPEEALSGNRIPSHQQYAVTTKRNKESLDGESERGRDRQILSVGGGGRRSNSQSSTDRLPQSRQALYDEPYEVSTGTYEVPFEERLRGDVDPRIARY